MWRDKKKAKNINNYKYCAVKPSRMKHWFLKNFLMKHNRIN